MTDFFSNDLREIPPMSGEAVPFKDLQNNEKIPENIVPKNEVNNNETKQEPKPKNKLVFYLSLIGGIFLLIVFIMFVLSIFLKGKNKISTYEDSNPIVATKPKESTASALPKQISDKFKDIEKNIYDDNYDEIDIDFPNIEWKIEFE